MEPLELTLANDSAKELKNGKRRYTDGNGHMLYFNADELAKLDSPDSVKVKIEPA